MQNKNLLLSTRDQLAIRFIYFVVIPTRANKHNYIQMKIFYIFIDIFFICRISVMFDMISTLKRYIGFEPIYHKNILYVAHVRVDLIFQYSEIYRDISAIYRDIPEIYLNDQI